MTINAWPVGNKFLVKADESEKETDSGIILTVTQPKFTGTVVKLPQNVEGFDVLTNEPVTEGADVYSKGSIVKEGTRIQWSSQTGFAVPVTITQDKEDTDYLLFTVRDVDLILSE
jgi:co-chaperonin GroES (HSP10)